MFHMRMYIYTFIHKDMRTYKYRSLMPKRRQHDFIAMRSALPALTHHNPCGKIYTA